MTAIRAYYDGMNFVPLQEYSFKPHQQVLIVVDDTIPKNTPVSMDKLESFASAQNNADMAQEYISTMREDRGY